jgi:hypothetical protein
MRAAKRVSIVWVCSVGQPKWDAFCDINVDFKVDLKDYFTTCKNFGKTNP